MTEESARIMLKRGIRPVEGGVSFSRDLRHRGYSLYGLVDGMCEEFARNIQCPHLLIKVLRHIVTNWNASPHVPTAGL